MSSQYLAPVAKRGGAQQVLKKSLAIHKVLNSFRIMDKELKTMLQKIIELLEEIKENTSETQWVKSEVNDVLTAVENLTTVVKKNKAL